MSRYCNGKPASGTPARSSTDLSICVVESHPGYNSRIHIMTEISVLFQYIYYAYRLDMIKAAGVYYSVGAGGINLCP